MIKIIKKVLDKLKGKVTTDTIGLQKLNFDDFDTSSPYGKCLKSISINVDVFEKGLYLTAYGPSKDTPLFSKFFRIDD